MPPASAVLDMPRNIYIYIHTHSALVRLSFTCILTIKVPETQIAELANSVDLDEAPHPDLHYLPSSP